MRCAWWPGNAMKQPTPEALPGLWREVGGLEGIVQLDAPAITPGMIVVALACEPWQTSPNLRWQVWPSELVRMH